MVLVRHGATEWSVSGQHTGVTDIPLTEEGRDAAAALRERLARPTSRSCWSARCARPRDRRAGGLRRPRAGRAGTCASWTTASTRGAPRPRSASERPGWSVWRDGSPGGESVERGRRARGARDRPRAGARRRRADVRARATSCGCSTARWLELPGRLRRPLPARHRRGVRARLRARASRHLAVERPEPPGMTERLTARLRGEPVSRRHHAILCELLGEPRVGATLGGVAGPDAVSAQIASQQAHWAQPRLRLLDVVRPRDGGADRPRRAVAHPRRRSRRGRGGLGRVARPLGRGLRDRARRRRAALRASTSSGSTNVVAYTLTGNRASRRVMEKLGFEYERDVVHADLPHVLYRRPRAVG